MAPFTASRYVIPSEFLCSERKLCIWDILRFQWQTLSSHDSIRHRNGTSRSHTSNIAPEWFAKRGWWNKSQTSLLIIYFRLSGFQSSLLFIYFRYGSHLYGTVHTCSHCTDQSETTNLSDKWRSFFEIGAAQLRPVTEIAPKSPFFCVERSLIRCCFHTGAKATCYSVTSWRQWYAG